VKDTVSEGIPIAKDNIC